MKLAAGMLKGNNDQAQKWFDAKYEENCFTDIEVNLLQFEESSSRIACADSGNSCLFSMIPAFAGTVKKKKKFISSKAFTFTRILQIPLQQNVRLESLYQIY